MFSQIFNGSYGFNAMALCAGALHRQVAFLAKNELTKSDEQREKAALARATALEFGDTGATSAALPEMSAEAWTAAFAASQRVVAIIAGQKDPEKGRSPDFLLTPTKDGKPRFYRITDLFEEQRHWMYETNKLDILAEAAKLNADPTKRLEAMRAEVDARIKSQLDRATEYYKKVKADVNKLSFEECVNTCQEALTNSGRSPDKEMQTAMAAMIAKQKERMEQGKWTSTDPGVWAIARGHKPPTAPSTTPATAQA